MFTSRHLTLSGDAVSKNMYKANLQEDESTSTACPECGRSMQLAGIDIYKCPKCGREVDMLEDDEL